MVTTPWSNEGDWCVAKGTPACPHPKRPKQARCPANWMRLRCEQAPLSDGFKN